VEASNEPPRVRLDVSASAGETEATITRLDPDGRTVEVRTTDGNPLPISAGTGLVYDYEAPFGQAVSYSSNESPTVVSAQVTVDVSEVWLIHVGIPDLSTPISLRVGSFDEETWAVQQAVLWPMGRQYPWVGTDGQRKAPASSIVVAVETATQLRALKSILSDASPLLLNVPVSLDLGVDTAYIAVGSVSNQRPSSIGSDALRNVTLPYQVVDRPVGGSQSERTWVDVLASYGSWTDVMTAYDTWADLLAGP
jgi:hypothetical protein